MSKNIENFTQTTSSTEEGKGGDEWWKTFLIVIAVLCALGVLILGPIYILGGNDNIYFGRQ